jgi:tetratricopeptide (TPR) repeat protein
MSFQTLDQIYTSFRAGFKDTPEFAIDFYKRNASVLDGLEHFASPSELKYFTEINWHYINALLQRDHYNQAIDEANITLPIIDFEAGRLNAPTVKDDWYCGILYLKGMAQYKLRNYKEAAPIFKTLLKEDPENDLYNKWYQNSLYGMRLRWVNAIWSVSAIILLFVLFFEEFIPSKGARLAITIVGFSGVVGNLVYEYYSRRSYRRNRPLMDQS